jgi:hypothetical protein
VRTWDRDGHELGIVRHLEKWSSAQQALVRAALARRYFLRRITAIEDITLEDGHIPDTDELPLRERELLRRYVYW